MAFKLSNRSLTNLQGVDQKLQDVIQYAIGVTKVDFAVIEGLRTLARQKELVASGASQTLKSKHIDGLAVDLMAYIGNRASWELNLYDDIATAVRLGAIEHDVPIRWGAAWHIPDIRVWDGSMQDAMTAYIDKCRKEGKRPFIDAPHFEINKTV